MKKVLIKVGVLALLLTLASPVFADRLHVQALTDFSTASPVNTITFQALDSIELGSDVKIWSGDIVDAHIQEIIPPNRLKRNASFKIVPVSYTDTAGTKHTINEEFIGKFSPKFELDKGQLAKNAALTVGNHFFQGLSLGYHALEGAVKNEEGNRVKSSVVSVYKNSPLSYVENGQELDIKEGDLFSFTFKTGSDEKDFDEE